MVRVIVENPVALDCSQRLRRLTDRWSGQADWLQPYVLRPSRSTRWPRSDQQAPVGRFDIAKLLAQRLDESVGGQIGCELFQIPAPYFASASPIEGSTGKPAISLISLLTMALARLSKSSIAITKAPGPPITFSR